MTTLGSFEFLFSSGDIALFGETTTCRHWCLICMHGVIGVIGLEMHFDLSCFGLLK